MIGFFLLLVCSQLFIDFDESLHSGFTDQTYLEHLENKQNRDYLSILRDLYNSNHLLLKWEKPPLYAIPHIIHQIWLGSPLPKQYKKWQETWKALHPGWDYKLWTEEDLATFALINQKAFDASKNYGEKANIWRYEILDRFGGLYVDTDFECLKAFDSIHDYYEFYAGLATIDRITMVNNGLIGSIPGHPILKECIRNVNKKSGDHGQLDRNGTIFFGHMIVQAYLENPTMDILIFPPTYFYPCPDRFDAYRSREKYVVESSFAIHYWDGSWVKQSRGSR